MFHRDKVGWPGKLKQKHKKYEQMSYERIYLLLFDQKLEKRGSSPSHPVVLLEIKQKLFFFLTWKYTWEYMTTGTLVYLCFSRCFLFALGLMKLWQLVRVLVHLEHSSHEVGIWVGRYDRS